MNRIQKNKEWLTFLNLVKNNNLNSVLEIGTGKGFCTLDFSLIAEGPIVSIDIDDRHDNIQAAQEKDMLTKPIFIIGESQSEKVLKKVKNINPFFDAIFIDGQHGYDNVKKDYENCLSLINKKRGIIGFHDILVTHKPWFGVHILWEEIKKKHKTLDILQNPRSWGGIGVILFGDIKT